MKVQSVGNYDCQRKKEVNFKATQNEGFAFHSTVDGGRNLRSQEREAYRSWDYIRIPSINLYRSVEKFFLRAANRALKKHARFYSG